MAGSNFDFQIIAENSTYKEFLVIDNRVYGSKRALLYQQAIELIEKNKDFREQFFCVLKEGLKDPTRKSNIHGEIKGDVNPYFFEVLPITKENYSTEIFSFVLIEAPELQGIQQDEM